MSEIVVRRRRGKRKWRLGIPVALGGVLFALGVLPDLLGTFEIEASWPVAITIVVSVVSGALLDVFDLRREVKDPEQASEEVPGPGLDPGSEEDDREPGISCSRTMGERALAEGGRGLLLIEATAAVRGHRPVCECCDLGRHTWVVFSTPVIA
ncbi:hypothetical protein PWG71_00710 [Nocardiopsis sp. N85]|uniref:hypothetical protein n=1 Tax=Nocardiopsis sp. N85 TaxID=3029400 RepID=UPI00237F0FDF|nr:hypothetical protein [Nocardiopsis sp. N85]MDE3719892.1 hypothetical protein [Nocardiopsis sp. N85]